MSRVVHFLVDIRNAFPFSDGLANKNRTF